jgi:hypothetical protein
MLGLSRYCGCSVNFRIIERVVIEHVGAQDGSD